MMVPLAVDTATGRAWEVQGRALLDAFAAYTDTALVVTPPEYGARVDGLLVVEGRVVGVVEARVRTTTLAALEALGGEYLITEAKLRAIVAVGRALAVPSYLVVAFGCGARWCWHVGDRTGRCLVGHTTRRSTTRATSVTPDTVERLNAYLPLISGWAWEPP